MQPVTDRNFDPRDFVAAGYDRCAEEYSLARGNEVPAYLAILTDRLAIGARIVDIGCGCGRPIAARLAEQHQVTGIDISRKQIELARQAVPNASFIFGDVTAFDFQANSFDAAIMVYTLFHIPRDDHPKFLLKLHSWLDAGGYCLLSLAEHSEAGYTEDGFFGTSMYWSNFSSDETITILRRTGFAVCWQGVTAHGYANQHRPEETHPLVLVQAM